MAIYKKRSDGRYQKELTLPDGSRKYLYATSIIKLREKEKQFWDSYGVVDQRITVGEWAVQWFKTYKSNLKPTTKTNYLNIYNTHILPPLGKMRLIDVKPIHLQNILNGCKTASESLQKKVIIILSGLFSTAESNGLIKKTPVQGLTVTKQNKPPKKKLLTPDESAALMAALTDPTERVFCALCLYAGLRRAEALGLQWGDISGDTITVHRSVTFTNTEAIVSDSVKSSSGFRTVPITTPLRQILNETPIKSLFVCPSRSGGNMTKSGFRRMWERICKTSGMLDLHPHMLRHTYCTMLYNAGIPLKTAQVLMGHSSISVTAQIYTHLSADNITESGTQLDDYIARII